MSCYLRCLENNQRGIDIESFAGRCKYENSFEKQTWSAHSEHETSWTLPRSSVTNSPRDFTVSLHVSPLWHIFPLGCSVYRLTVFFCAVRRPPGATCLSAASEWCTACYNGGSCLETRFGIMCQCPRFWSGPQCKDPITCHDLPCKQASACLDYVSVIPLARPKWLLLLRSICSRCCTARQFQF